MEYQDDGIDYDEESRDAYREKEERLDQVARESQAAIDALPAGREKQMVIAVDVLLSNNLGSAEGYLGAVGLPATRALQRALSAYGVTPDYGQSIGRARRTYSRT